MPTTLDPIATAERLERDYRSYLATTFAPRDPSLRAEFETALAAPDRTRKGPIVQATPPYLPGRTLREFVDDGALHHDLLHVDPATLPPDRPLHVHQEHAVTAAGQGRNLIVATGTGSGKTECYLLPILDRLLTERAQGTIDDPGVRALLLYPMNALANDQMARIRGLFSAFPELTFGRYTGETLSDPAKALDKYKEQHRQTPPAGELIDRETMQQRPPHVLLTNFAMLEYLLLRPADSSLFDGPTGHHWRFLVLDEVHVYDGAKGAEVGMLLRRVRDRVHGSERNRLQCIGTSATLGRGQVDSELISEFASNLFDEQFEPTDIVHPRRAQLATDEGRWTLTRPQLDRLHELWREGADGVALGEAVDRATDARTSVALHQLLRDEGHLVEIQTRLQRGSCELHDLATVAHDLDDPKRAVVQLVDLGIAARQDEASAPLLPARYHVWLRASEGSFACLHPDHPGDEPRLILDRHERCQPCERRGIASTIFELGVCRHCRTHYVVGDASDEHVTLAGDRDESVTHFLILESGGADVDPDSIGDEDEDALAPEDPHAGAAASGQLALCLSCGGLSADSTPCTCDQPRRVSIAQASPRRDQAATKCLSCQRRSPNGIVQRFLSGSDAPVAVVATSLYQSLPTADHQTRRTVAGGRKLLMFSDSRQDAAFFAPYLARTYGRAIERRMVWKRLGSEDEPYLFTDLIQPLRRDSERAELLDEDEGRSNNDRITTWLMAEVLATDRRQSLDGLGLAEIVPRLPRRFEPPDALLQLGLDEAAALDVVRVLLETLRQSAAVTVPDGVNVTEDLRFAPRNTTSRVREATSEPRVLAWLPGRGQNRRSDYLAKLIDALGVSADPIDILRRTWVHLTDGGLDTLLVSESHPKRGITFAIDHERIEFRTTAAGSQPHQCDTCRQIWWRNVAGVCPTFKCAGNLAPLHQRPPSHYAELYERLDPTPLTVEEHTGQLRPDRAAELQQKFTDGELNALSCSTTFELGVDVGEVQSILLRNVPPSAANYVQRAGRAGRRLGSAALVTCFAQRRSHDRNYFDTPHEMIDGVIPAPVLQIDNEAIVRRHAHAIAWAQFDRERVEHGGQPISRVSELVEGDDESLAADFLRWMRSHPGDLHDTLTRVIPTDAARAIGVADWSWVDRLESPDESGVGGWLSDLVGRVRNDLEQLEQLEEEASAEKKYSLAASLQRTRRTISERRLLDQFAQGGILPKYGFPVDVAQLDVSRSASGADLELSRDLRLGILEFAPGAKVVAANKLWICKGIRQLPGRQLPEYEWAVCDGCGTFRSELTGIETTDDAGLRAHPCGHCGSYDFARNQSGSFVIPLFGFVGDNSGEEPGENRPRREGHLQTHFAEYDGGAPETETIELGGVPLRTWSSRRGWITVFNRGRSKSGFAYCSRCGYAAEVPPSRTSRSSRRTTHQTPTGRDCSGQIRRRDLGHRFMTNVVEMELPDAGTVDSNRSALHALIAAASRLGITPGDIGGSLSIGPGGRPTIVIYDDVPGGAGHARYLMSQLEAWVAHAVEIVRSCSCGEETSCYGCLRNYRNQLVHDTLSRRGALDVFERLLARP